jgi:hypothetical protein
LRRERIERENEPLMNIIWRRLKRRMGKS